MITARTFGKLTQDGGEVQKFRVYDKTHFIPVRPHFEGDNIKYHNLGDHNGDKGKPPILGPPMLPVNLMLSPSTPP